MTMKPSIRSLSAVLAVAFLAACGADRSVSARSDAVLSDARSDGVAGFYFLPPVAPEPGGATVNDPRLSPAVVIDALGADGSVLVTLARFEGDAVKASGSHYMVHWSTRTFVPVLGTTYRIRVLLDGEELGFAEAQVASHGRELRLLGSNEIFGINGQRTVPIKFRIHVEPEETCAEGAACEDGDPCTVEDVCVAGACTAGDPRVCPPRAEFPECNPGACDPEQGCVTFPVEDGTSCGVFGYCDLDPVLGYSVCLPIGGGKLSP
jgi:hypothetical protein